MCNPSRPYLPIFLQGCEIKSGRVRPGFEAIVKYLYPFEPEHEVEQFWCRTKLWNRVLELRHYKHVLILRYGIRYF